jgi:hypothetical protein
MKGIRWATVRAVAGATVMLVACANASAGQTPTEERALQRFGQAVSEYARLHHQLERSLPPLEVTDDMEALYEAIDALADRIREARPHAREGDIFDPAVSHFLRIRIETTLRDHEIDLGELLADIMADVPPGTERPRVNERFPWEWGAAVPLCVLEVLPELPEDLEYRFAGRDLVLVDIHAELVVDLMFGALPPPPTGVLTSGWKELVPSGLGSTTHHVIREAHCPVLTLRSDDNALTRGEAS